MNSNLKMPVSTNTNKTDSNPDIALLKKYFI